MSYLCCMYLISVCMIWMSYARDGSGLTCAIVCIYLYLRICWACKQVAVFCNKYQTGFREIRIEDLLYIKCVYRYMFVCRRLLIVKDRLTHGMHLLSLFFQYTPWRGKSVDYFLTFLHPGIEWKRNTDRKRTVGDILLFTVDNYKGSTQSP